jgi:hypothetical protein
VGIPMASRCVYTTPTPTKSPESYTTDSRVSYKCGSTSELFNSLPMRKHTSAFPSMLPMGDARHYTLMQWGSGIQG